MKRLLIALFVLAVLAPAIALADWPQAKHDAQHTSVADSTLKPPLAVDWQTNIGGEAISSPIIYNGTLFAGNGDGKEVYALDAASGRQLWKFTTGGSVESTPAAANGSVVVCSYDGYVYRLDASTGKQLWKYYAKSGIYSSPLIYDNKVFVGTDDGSFYALNLDSGLIAWSLPKATQSSPAADKGRVFVGTYDGTFYALDAESGHEVWSYDTKDSIHSSPLIHNNTVYVATRNGTLYAFDTISGSIRWTYDLGYNADATPSINPATETLYIGTYGGRLFALDATNGSLRWVSDFYGPIYQSVAVSGCLYGATQDGKLFALDSANGSGLWTYSLKSGAFASPAVDGGRLYMATLGGDIVAFKESADTPTTPPSSTSEQASTPFLEPIICAAAILLTANLYRRNR